MQRFPTVVDSIEVPNAVPIPLTEEEFKMIGGGATEGGPEVFATEGPPDVFLH
jgi:hypothetical protein